MTRLLFCFCCCCFVDCIFVLLSTTTSTTLSISTSATLCIYRPMLQIWKNPKGQDGTDFKMGKDHTSQSEKIILFTIFLLEPILPSFLYFLFVKAVFFEVVWNWQTCFVSFSFLLLFFFFALEIQLHIFLLDYCIWKPLSLTLSGYFHMGDILCLFWWLHISTIALSQQYRKHFEKLIAHRYIVFVFTIWIYLPAYSHHDKIPPWWECVRSLDDDLIMMMIMIMMIYI